MGNTDGALLGRIHGAIVDAYDRNGLTRLLRFKLEVRLDEVVTPGNLPSEVFELLDWFDDRDRLADLVNAAAEDRPNSNELAQLSAELEMQDRSPVRVAHDLKQPVDKLSLADRDEIANIIAGLPSFADSASARRQFVERAGLEEAVGDLNYGSAPGSVAWEITKRAHSRGQMQVDGESRHAFRLLLDRIMATRGLGGEGQSFVAGIIGAYDFS